MLITISDKYRYITNIIISASIDYYTIALTMIFIVRSRQLIKFRTLSSSTTFPWTEIDDAENLASLRTRNNRGEFIFHDQMIYLSIVYADQTVTEGKCCFHDDVKMTDWNICTFASFLTRFFLILFPTVENIFCINVVLFVIMIEESNTLVRYIVCEDAILRYTTDKRAHQNRQYDVEATLQRVFVSISYVCGTFPGIIEIYYHYG